MCAERNAIANMITNGEKQIDKIATFYPDGRTASPCCACRELMMQLDSESKNIEVLMDYESRKTVILEKLVPDWWGSDRYMR